MSNDLSTWLKYAQYQIAAEAFLDRTISGPMTFTETD